MADGGWADSHAVVAAVAAGGVDDIAALLRDLRRRHARQSRDSPLTYRELAAKTGWSQAAIGEYFSGRTLPPTDRLDALAVLLGATAAEQSALATARDRVDEARRVAARVGGPTAPVARQLPADVSGFAGRAVELERLDALLDECGRPAAVVISAVSGTAGVGKTALAVHWAHRVANQFGDGQLYINLRGFDPGGSPMAPAEATRRFLDALEVPPQRIPADPDTQTAMYRSVLAGKKMLILLDNARDPAQVRPLLPGTPGCLVLITSRNDLSGLVATDGARPLPLNLLTPTEAHDLLTRRLGSDRMATEPEAVEQLIAACARLPLALAIVAARATTQPQLPLTALAGELHDRQNRLDALSTGEATTDVRAVISWSYHALTPEAARLFRLLGLHPGPDISGAAAASLTGLPPPRVRPLLAELTRANLLVERTAGRYSLHDLLRAYAAQLTHCADSDEQRHTATHRILDHYLHTAYTADRLLAPARDSIHLTPQSPGVSPEAHADHEQALDWFTTERPVLLAMIDQAATGFDTHIWQLARTLDHFLDWRGHWHDLAAIKQAAVAAAGRLDDPTAEAGARRLLARAYVRVGRLDDARTQLLGALDLSTRIGDLTEQAHTHHTLAYVWERQDRPANALTHCRQALDLFRAAGHQAGQADALNGIGWMHALLGDHRQALTYCRKALPLFQEIGDRGGQAGTWDSLGYIHHHLGQYPMAVTCYEHAIDLFRNLGDRYSEATTLTRLGNTHHATSNSAAARETWQHALTILADLDHPETDHVRGKLAAL
jgi:tetratricopeptide (TPR) repeat protein/transcriptional regulator with XRE-family HTH domain